VPNEYEPRPNPCDRETERLINATIAVVVMAFAYAIAAGSGIV